MKIIKVANLTLISVLMVLYGLIAKEEDVSSHFHQNDYHVVPERADVISYNKEYIKRFYIHTFKYNRSTTAFNGSMEMKVDFGLDLELVAQVYKWASNEYRLFPLRVQLNFCKAINTDIAGVHTGFMKCGNFSRCPLKKEKIYHLCHFTLDDSKLPPYIPSGKYMIEVQGMYSGEEMLLLRAYAEVTRPLV